MTFCAIVKGKITYKNKKDFDQIVENLFQENYLIDNSFLNENNQKIIGLKQICYDTLTIQIPQEYYRDLTNFQFFPEDQGECQATGYLVWGSTDGCFLGVVIENGNRTTYDLEKWALEKKMKPKPHKENDLYIWMRDIVKLFLSSMHF
jgi:hypothetical protein